jgi:HEPN domain-containing protein
MSPKTELVVEWLSKADDDLRAADLLLAAKPPIYWAAAFHAQQVAEKLLKGLLTYHEIEYEKSHDIDYLMGLCIPVAPEAHRIRDAAATLTEYAVEPRYPAPGLEAAEAEAPEALRIAREVRRFVHELLPPALVGRIQPS